jgi:hypothetical protein
MASTNQAPYVNNYPVSVPAVAAESAHTIGILVAPYAGVITAASYTPNSTITGASATERTFQIVNKGQAGTGATVAAQLVTATATNLTGFESTPIPLSGTPANLVVNQGDVLAFVSSDISTGTTDPGGIVNVQLSGSDTGTAVTPPYYEIPSTTPTGADQYNGGTVLGTGV